MSPTVFIVDVLATQAQPLRPRAKGQGPRAKGQGPRAKGQGPRAKGQGPRAKGQGPRSCLGRSSTLNFFVGVWRAGEGTRVIVTSCSPGGTSGGATPEMRWSGPTRMRTWIWDMAAPKISRWGTTSMRARFSTPMGPRTPDALRHRRPGSTHDADSRRTGSAMTAADGEPRAAHMTVRPRR